MDGKNDINKVEPCQECNGEGQIWFDTKYLCTVYIGDCCGGCGYYMDCENCNGTGEVEIDEEE
jgi:DnaJ-class molecular chaperone